MTKSRQFRLVFLMYLFLSMTVVVLTALLQPSPAVAQCVKTEEEGQWFISNVFESPYGIKIRHYCGDVSLCDENGDCVEPRSAWLVVVSEKQQDGKLYNRPQVEGQYGVSPKGTKWLLAEVPTGGYVDHMQMRMVEKDGEKYLRVRILHKSVDIKPDATSDLWFRQTEPRSPVDSGTGGRRPCTTRDCK